MPLPDDLFKPRPGRKFDERRAHRVIRVQGFLNILLLLCLAAVILWTRYDTAKTTHRILAETNGASVAFAMPLKAFGDDRLLGTNDTVETPIVTVYGKIEEYDRLRASLSNFSVTLNNTSVMPKPNSGEFSGKIVLNEGANDIVIAVSWDGAERYRTSYSIAYFPPAPTAEASSTSEMTLP